MFIRHAQFSGFSTYVDGTENARIRCINSGGVASEALPTITENTATLLSEAQRQDDDDRDTFADLDDDEEELETNGTASRGLVDNIGNSWLFFNHMIVVLHTFTTCSSDRNKRRPLFTGRPRIVAADCAQWKE